MITTPVIEAKIKIPTNGKDYVPDFILPPYPISHPELGWDKRVSISIDEPDFSHGCRTIVETDSNGEIIYRDIALTPEDFLNPQLGDHMPQDPEHAKIGIAIYDRLEKHVKEQPNTMVFFDTKMLWRIPGLQEPFPDVSVVPNVRDMENIRGSFDCRDQGTRPCLIVEVMSPGYPGDDTKKVKIYQQAGVTEYIILNPHFENKSLPMELTGYRLIGKQYQPILPDAQGRLLSQTVRVKFGVDETKRNLILTHASSGQKLLTNKEEQAARLKAESRADTESIARNAESIARAQAEARAAMLEARLQELEKLLQANNLTLSHSK